jgi:hypothetical protein
MGTEGYAQIKSHDPCQEVPLLQNGKSNVLPEYYTLTTFTSEPVERLLYRPILLASAVDHQGCS